MKQELIACFLVAVAISVPTAFSASNWGISGTVVDETGDPITAAEIDVDGSVRRVDGSGSFRVKVGAAAVVLVKIQADGYYAAVHAFQESNATQGEAREVVFELVAKTPQRRLLLFAGDAMLARRYFEPRADEPPLVRQRRTEQDGKQLLKFVKPYVEVADYASVNLETQLISAKPKRRLPKSVTFYSPPELAAVLRWAGFDYVALGNNHTWDYKDEGLASTLRALDKAGLDYSGAGLTEVVAREPAVVNVDGQSFGFLSYVGWAGTFQPSQVAVGSKGGAALGVVDSIAEDLRSVATGIPTILQYHSGLEYREEPAMSEQTQLRLAIDRGADIAIGHHSHVLQGFEIYKQRLLTYSLGNFLFDQYHYTTQMGMLVYVWMDGEKLHRAEVVPLHINGYVPTPATGAFRYSVLHRLARLSRPFGTCLRTNGANAVVARCATDDVQRLDLGQREPGHAPVPLAQLGMAATSPVALKVGAYSYRLGTDILRRGDFEYSGLFAAHDRAWETGRQVEIDDDGSRVLRISVDRAAVVRTGMKVFERVFSASNPTTISGRIRTDGAVTVRFLLQRRRSGDTLTDALLKGPTRVIGGLSLSPGGWQAFSFDFDQPRITTRSVRLLIEVRAAADNTDSSNVLLDDLAWVEWRTPWLSGDEPAAGEFATHVQFHAAP